MRTINKIILHCSASDEPHTIADVKRLHTTPEDEFVVWAGKRIRGKGFNDVGYHYFITKSGNIQRGRSVEVIGAHCLHFNGDSIGICLEGDKSVGTHAQIRALRGLLHKMRNQTRYAKCTLHGHREFTKEKTCPNVNYLALQQDWYANTLL